jgi:acyl-CoA reductase-like NAD-dependent aldehyde dehydrogenase
MASTLYVSRSVAAIRKASVLPLEERIAALRSAGMSFLTGMLEGISSETYQLLVSRVSGLPISAVRQATRSVARAAEQAYLSTRQGCPQGATSDWRDSLTRYGQGVWTRKGEVFAVHAAGNHPGVHAVWLEAVALGYRVAVRPSRREPFTPHRLVAALREAGFGEDRVILLPTDHSAADDVLRAADFGMVYGGDEVIAKYRPNCRVLPQGPGRSKILVAGDKDWREYVDMIVDSVSSQGGTACINTTSVFVEGDPRPLAETVAAHLARIPSLPPEDESAVLPTQPLEAARRIDAYLRSKARGATPLLGGDSIVDELPGGGAVLRPSVHLVADPDAPQIGVELPFPCVWFAPWTTEDGVRPLRNTLVLSAITDNPKLLDALLAEPTISNLYIGAHPTHWLEPGMPHDSYLSDFLMRTKAVIRD